METKQAEVVCKEEVTVGVSGLAMATGPSDVYVGLGHVGWPLRPPASTFTPFPAAASPLLLAAPGSLCGGGFPRELSGVAGTPTPHPATQVPAPNTSRPALHCFSPQQGSVGNDHVCLSPCVASPRGSRQTEPVQRHPTKHGPSLRIYAGQRTPLPCLMGPAKWISSWRPH